MKILLLMISVSLTSLAAGVTTRAQQTYPTNANLSADDAQSNGQDEAEFIEPSRPVMANSAEIQKAGVLQLEYGLDSFHHAKEYRAQESAPMTLRFAATSRLLFDFDLETVKSQTDKENARTTGIGETRLGAQAVVVKGADEHPALAFAYFIKLPTASERKGLGTGRVDHRIVTLVSRKFGQTEIDFNAAYLVVGREQARGWTSGGQFALAASHEPERKGFGVQGEISMQTKQSYAEKGAFALGALIYRVNRRLRLDGGMRFGLNRDAPRVSAFAGFVVGVADLYQRR